MTTFNRDEFRVQLLLQLPERGLTMLPPRVPSGLPSEVFPESDLHAEWSADPHYDAGKLAAWILAQVDAAVALENDQAESLQLAGAAGVVSSSLEFGRYLAALSEALKQGHGLAAQWDLSRTLAAESDRLLQVAGQLLARFPGLAQVAGAAPVNESEEGLALPLHTP